MELRKNIKAPARLRDDIEYLSTASPNRHRVPPELRPPVVQYNSNLPPAAFPTLPIASIDSEPSRQMERDGLSKHHGQPREEVINSQAFSDMTADYWLALDMAPSDGVEETQESVSGKERRYSWRDLTVGHQLSIIDAVAERAKVTLSDGLLQVFVILGLNALEQEQAVRYLQERAASLEKEDDAINEWRNTTNEWLLGPGRHLSSSDQQAHLQSALQQKLYGSIAEDHQHVSTKGELAVAQQFAADIGLGPDALGEWSSSAIENLGQDARGLPRQDPSVDLVGERRAEEGEAQATGTGVEAVSLQDSPGNQSVFRSLSSIRGRPAVRDRIRGHQRTRQGNRPIRPSGLRRVSRASSGTGSSEPAAERPRLILRLPVNSGALQALSRVQKDQDQGTVSRPIESISPASGQIPSAGTAPSGTAKAAQTQDPPTGILPASFVPTVNPWTTSGGPPNAKAYGIRDPDPYLQNAARISLSLAAHGPDPTPIKTGSFTTVQKPAGPVLGVLGTVQKGSPAMPHSISSALDPNMAAGTTDATPKTESWVSTLPTPDAGVDASSAILEEATPSPSAATLVTPIVIRGVRGFSRRRGGRGRPKGVPSGRPRGRPRGSAGTIRANAGGSGARGGATRGSVATPIVPPTAASLSPAPTTTPSSFVFSVGSTNEDSPAAAVKNRTDRKKKRLSPS